MCYSVQYNVDRIDFSSLFIWFGLFLYIEESGACSLFKKNIYFMASILGIKVVWMS